ncbi:hypothetical protein R1sor_021169 [Riccia sorocarpa]|uniref:F-box domain-containing protein n=1 Tax=Riccia sorocarpa TaxID=122646 RepID=A0ABD3GGC0_9MARC
MGLQAELGSHQITKQNDSRRASAPKANYFTSGTSKLPGTNMDPASPIELQAESTSTAAVQCPRAKACPSLTPSIWEKLPDELLEIVLTKLPISALRKFCRLSKRWRAFIRSEQFAHRCQSRQLTVVYFDPYADNRSVPPLYTAIPSPRTRRWKKHFLKFIAEDELVDGLLAADQGLLCYRVRKKGRIGQCFQFEEIVLIVHNLFTRKWRRLVVPYNPDTETRMKAVMYQNNMLVGLCVDETGSYKLVAAFLDKDLTNKTFVYNSSSTSWTISAAMFPGLEQRDEFSEWDIPRSICCAGELYWLVEEADWNLRLDDVYPHFKTMIKYSMKLDTWSMVTQQQPCEEACHLHLACFENQLALVNFDDVSEKKTLFPEEFSSLVPGLVKFDAQACRDVMDKAVYSDSDEDDCFEYCGYYKPRKAAVEGSAMFIYSELDGFADVSRLQVILGFNKDSPTVIELPSPDLDDSPRIVRVHGLYLDAGVAPFLFASTLKAFV